MSENAPGLEVFRYEKPEYEGKKAIVPLAKTDRLFANVQVISWGGETVLHAHNHLDGFWFVLSGRLRFYSDEDTLVAEVGKHEGVLIQRGAKYWFETVGDDPTEVLQIEASDRPFGNPEDEKATRTYHEVSKPLGRQRA